MLTEQVSQIKDTMVNSKNPYRIILKPETWHLDLSLTFLESGERRPQVAFKEQGVKQKSGYLTGFFH